MSEKISTFYNPQLLADSDFVTFQLAMISSRQAYFEGGKNFGNVKGWRGRKAVEDPRQKERPGQQDGEEAEMKTEKTHTSAFKIMVPKSVELKSCVSLCSEGLLLLIARRIFSGE